MSAKDKWLEELDNADRIAYNCENLIENRRHDVRNGQDVSKINSNIRRLLNELARTIQDLEDLLNTSAAQYHITDEQYAQRQDNISQLKSRRDEMQTSYSQGSGGPSNQSSATYRNPSFTQGGDRNNRGYSEFDDTMQRQEQIMRDQDQGIDILQQSIQRQKDMGLAISDELDLHDELLDDLSYRMDSTDGKLKSTTDRVITVTEKAKGQGLCCCIAMLVLAIIILGIVPAN